MVRFNTLQYNTIQYNTIQYRTIRTVAQRSRDGVNVTQFAARGVDEVAAALEQAERIGVDLCR